MTAIDHAALLRQFIWDQAPTLSSRDAALDDLAELVRRLDAANRANFNLTRSLESYEARLKELESVLRGQHLAAVVAASGAVYESSPLDVNASREYADLALCAAGRVVGVK